MIKGETLQNNDQIILDYAFAAKYKLKIGDKLPIRDDTLTVAGLSGGTNLFVIQFAFITLNEARKTSWISINFILLSGINAEARI